MKKLGEVAFILAGVVLVVAVLNWAMTPGSERVMKELREEKAKGVPLSASTMRHLWFDLAKALNDEDRPDEAIRILNQIIMEGRNPENVYGDERPMIGADWYFLGEYYKELARAYQMKGDGRAEGRALGKMAQARAMEKTLRAAEEARREAREKRAREAVLR